MSDTKGASLTDRLKTAATAKQALLAKFRPKPAVADPLFEERRVAAEAELKAVRAERQAARAAKRDAAVVEAPPPAAAPPKTKRAPPTEAEAKDKRDARYAARKSRR